MSMIGNFRMVTESELDSVMANPATIEDFLYAEAPHDADEIDVDKAWHGIHFLLCGDAWAGEPPLNFIVGGGADIGDVEVGYGPARAFTVQQVTAIANALEPIDSKQLRAKFDPKSFTENEIYPEVWDEPATECMDGYVLGYFEDLKKFVQRAAKEGKALIAYVN